MGSKSGVRKGYAFLGLLQEGETFGESKKLG